MSDLKFISEFRPCNKCDEPMKAKPGSKCLPCRRKAAKEYQRKQRESGAPRYEDRKEAAYFAVANKELIRSAWV